MYRALVTIIRPFLKILFRIKIQGDRQLPEGPVVVIGNHTSNFDPFIVSILFDRQIHWMAKKELFSNKILAYILEKVGAFPVDRKNNDIRSMRKAISILKEGKVLGIFPEGTRVKTIDYTQAKSGAALIASRMGAKVVPIYIEGKIKPFSKITVHRRPDLALPSGKRTEEEYEKDMVGIMKNIYEGVQYDGNTP